MVSAAQSGTRRRAPVLVTGFEPFGGEAVNPSWLAASALGGKSMGGHPVIAAQLPTVFGGAIEALRRLLMEHRPVLVVGTGQAGGRSAISLERVAINVNDARIPDNVRAQPVDTPVVDGGPAAYFTSLPIKAMHAALQQAGVRSEVSQTAGTFVCNHAFYGLMHELATQPSLRDTRGGFVHVPWLPEQGAPSMALDELVRGLGIAIACALETKTDVKREAGALD